MFQQMTYVDAYIKFILVTSSPHNAKMTIGRYQRTNRPILIISKMADTDNQPIIGASLVMCIILSYCSAVAVIVPTW